MKSILVLSFVVFCPVIGLSQGCSDAGFCSVGTLGHQASNTASRGDEFAVFLTTGSGDQGVFVFTPALQYQTKLSSSTSLQARITGGYASGNLGSVAGPGDVYATAIISPTQKKVRRFRRSVTLGVKIPLNKGDLAVGGESLPMAYQSSLGTVDVITGVTIADERWQFSVALQQPLTGGNGNSFDPSRWGNPESADYFPSNRLGRKGDVLVRAAHYVSVRSRLRLSGGLLGIYHLSNDDFRGTGTDMSRMELRGSQGLTLNATASLIWLLKPSYSVGFSTGVPLVVRDSRPDGLTRSWVFSPEIRFRF